MAELWVAGVATVAAGVLSSRSAKKQAKKQFKQKKELLSLENRYAKEQAQFGSELDYYYRQLGRKETERGLDEFRKFNTVSQFAPEYANTSPGIIVPEKPNAAGSPVATNVPVAVPPKG